MKKHFILIAILFTFVLLLSGCKTDKQADAEIPKVDISVNGQRLLCVGKQSDEAADAAGLSGFDELIKSENELPYIHLGDSVEFLFGFTPKENELTVYDRILTNTGSDKYAADATETINLNLTENKCGFDLTENPAAMASSDSEDYESGKTIRGFSFSVKYEGKEYLYAFAVRTDAKQ